MDRRSGNRHPPTPRTKSLLLLEYGLLFIALPLSYAYDWVPLPVIPALWVLSAGCLAWLLLNPRFRRRKLWDVRPLREQFGPIALTFLLGVPVLLAATLLLAPERLFGMVRERPLLWALIMISYPVLSVYPQGIVYRVFIFHRYRRLFPTAPARIAASAIAFSTVHIVFDNWIAPVFSLAGGVLFAWTYERSGSALPAAFQHALFGCLLFTLGLGWYFYSGAAGP